MDDLDKILSLAEKSTGGIESTGNIITQIYRQYIAKYSAADQYLNDVIKEKGKPSAKDMEMAARLYAVPKMRRHYKNIANILVKADQLYEQWKPQEDEMRKTPEDDWIDYFLDRAKTVSDETVQRLWACILTQECFEQGTFRRVMLDRLALLDRSSAALFQILCDLTYDIEVSDGRNYSVPLYIRDTELCKMVHNTCIDFTEEDAMLYKNYFSINARVLHGSEIEEELEVLQEIGLVNLSEENDESDIYSIENIEFTVSTENKKFKVPPQYDEQQEVYYIVTGCMTFTKIGLELYKTLKKQIVKPSFFLKLVESFMDYGEFRNSGDEEQSVEHMENI